MLGLGFGVLVLTWTFSGFTSMQPRGWLESGPDWVGHRPPHRVSADQMAGRRPALEAQAAALRTNPARSRAALLLPA